jgi:conjugal transfer pilus assembly protein TraU
MLWNSLIKKEIRVLIRLLFLFLILSRLAFSEGKWVNPLTDICWDCLFPITLGGVNVTPGKGSPDIDKKAICFCKGTPPKVGIPISFWEPARLVDVTRHAYTLVGLGGIKVGKESVKNRGTVGILDQGPSQNSFYHVHWYMYPILSWLGFLTDFECIETGDIDIGYMSELDPLWGDDQLSLVINAESALFSNPITQSACIADCGSSTVNKPLDNLFWCAGCMGSLYPFTGTVAHHEGALPASYLILHRAIAKLHRELAIKVHAKGNYCQKSFEPLIQKSVYKSQLVYPVSLPLCSSLGASNLKWGNGASFPYQGEDFVYLLWIRRQCCLDAVKPAVGGTM